MSEIGLGIIGAGQIAREHLKVIKALPGVKAVGITSRTPSKAEELAQKYDIDQVYKTPKELLKTLHRMDLWCLFQPSKSMRLSQI